MFDQHAADLIGLPLTQAIGGSAFRDLFAELKTSSVNAADISLPDGRTLTASSAIIRHEKVPIGMVTVLRDITQRKQAEDALRQRNHELALLNRAGQAFSSTLDLDQVLETVLEEVRRLMGILASSVWLIDPTAGNLVCRQATGPASEMVRGWHLPPGEGLVGWVAQHRQSLIVSDTADDERYYTGVEDKIGLALRSSLTVPMQIKDRVIGVIQVVAEEPGRFQPADLMLLEPLAASASIAIENARLVEGLEAEVASRTAEIAAERDKSTAILNSVGDAIAMINVAMEVEYVNAAFTTMTGYSVSDVLGKPLALFLDSETQEQVRKRAMMSRDGRWQGEVYIRRKDGRTYDAAMTVTSMREADEHLMGYVTCHQDISQSKALDRARSQFITNVSHQLRTPVTTLRLYTHLLKNVVQSESGSQYLEMVNAEVDRLTHLIQDILVHPGRNGSPVTNVV
jgi:PAS domain S-box-containing protein